MTDIRKSFLKFCESKPADETYLPYNSCECALAQFGYARVNHTNCVRYGIPVDLYEAVTMNWPFHVGGVTFGMLASRLRRRLNRRAPSGIERI